MSAMTKYLFLSMVMTMVTVPVYFYSQSMVNHSAAPAGPVAVEPAQEQDPAPTASTPPPAEPDIENTNLSEPTSTTQAAAEEQTTNPQRFSSLATLYRPPLFGKCKKLFERFNRKHFPDKPFKAFVYSFDGESAYCADAYTDKGQAAAEEIVLRECEAHHAGSGKYSPCRIYSVE